MVQCMFSATLKASYGTKNKDLFQRKRSRKQKKRKQFITQLERLELMSLNVFMYRSLSHGEEMIKDILYHVQGMTTELIRYEEVD